MIEKSVIYVTKTIITHIYSLFSNIKICSLHIALSNKNKCDWFRRLTSFAMHLIKLTLINL
jgi:hypothetical protein